ncbi:MAG: hypothetical protein ACT4NP_11985 [Pseudonocardiales bacterium]
MAPYRMFGQAQHQAVLATVGSIAQLKAARVKDPAGPLDQASGRGPAGLEPRIGLPATKRQKAASAAPSGSSPPLYRLPLPRSHVPGNAVLVGGREVQGPSSAVGVCRF